MRSQQRILKALSLLLIAVLCLTACPISTLADTPEGAASAAEEAVTLCEDVSRRDVYEKHFARSDGSFVAAVYAEPVHYQNASGEWEEIDNRLTPSTEDGVPVLKNQSSPMEVTFAESPAEELGSIRYGGYTLRWRMTAKASEAERQALPENPDTPSTEETLLPEIFARPNTLSAADLLNPEVFRDDLTIRQPDRDYTLDSAAQARVIEEPASSPADAEQEAMAVSDLTGSVEYTNALPGIDFTYTVHAARVKEEIILNAPTAITSYRTRIEAAGLTPTLLEDQSVQFASPDGEVIFDIPAPFMFDADGAYSEEIVVRLEQVDESTCELIYIPDYAWLQADDRAYPVTIDPSYQATPMMYGSDKTQDTYVYSGSPNSNYYSSAYLKVGRNYQSYVKFPTLPDIGSNYLIYSAQLRLAAVSDAPVIRLCRVTGDWSSSTLTWNNQPGASAFLNLAANGQFYLTYDVTEVVSGWYSGKYPNYGFMIQDPQWSDVTEWNLYSSDCGNSNVMPGLQVCYYPMSNRNISTGTYFIRSRGTGKYLNVMNGTAANASNVGVSDFTGELAQQWYVVNHGNGLYSIRSNINRSYYLDVDGGQDTNERNVQIYADSSRRYRIRWNGNPTSTSITPSFSNTKALDVYGGQDASRYNTNVQIYRYSHGENQSWEFEEVNGKIFGDINSLNQLAVTYTGNNSNSTKGLVFEFIRSSVYNSPMWVKTAGSVDNNFINYVNAANPSLNYLRNSRIYINDPIKGPVDFTHFSATADTILTPGTIASTALLLFSDLSGWAGDLQSLIMQTKSATNNSNVYSIFYNKLHSLVGASEAISNFSMPDLLADLDAKHFAETMGSGYLGDLLVNYYSSQCQNRVTYFINYYITFNPGLPTYRDRLIAYVKGYTSNTTLAPLVPWPLFDGQLIADNQSQAAADAFVDYLLYAF